jgi:hypothetical protein
LDDDVLETGSIMTHAERATIKRQMSIGEYPGENDLNRAWSVTTYVHANGEKYAVTFSNGEVFATIPGRVIIRDTLEQLREAVIAALAEKEKPAYEGLIAAAVKDLLSSRSFRVVP